MMDIVESAKFFDETQVVYSPRNAIESVVRVAEKEIARLEEALVEMDGQRDTLAANLAAKEARLAAFKEALATGLI